MSEKKILYLTLKRQWFEQIRSGEKTEEYREIKQYWLKRLFFGNLDADFGTLEASGYIRYVDEGLKLSYRLYKKWGDQKNHVPVFDIIRFTNGYGKSAPTFDIECLGISIGVGKPEWGGSGETFIIKLGKIIKQ